MTRIDPEKRSADSSAVLLMAHGAPERVEDVPAFLLSLRDGRPLPQSAVDEVINRYQLIGGGSPLLRLTNLQAAALSRLLGERVYVGMRNWKPFIAEGVREAARDGAGQLVAVCLAPQNSRTSVGLYRKYLEDARDRVAPGLALDFIESWHDHPGLIAAFAEKVRQALDLAQAEARCPVPVLFTAHSVPERTIAAGDPYARQVCSTAELVARALALEAGGWSLAYQSQGMTADPWIGPTLESEIDRWRAAGHLHLVVAPVGFVCDHVEVLYDIDVAARQHARARGVTLWRSESLNDSPTFIRALASIVQARRAKPGVTL